MRERPGGEIIELVAKDPDGDLACDFTIANDMARSGLREGLAAGLRSVRPIEAGVEATFAASAWESVQRYVTLESQCCSFLTLLAERSHDAVTLRVTGRPDAQELIRNIFSNPDGLALP
jgi:hypothetical protein